MKRKVILAILISVSIAVAMVVSCDYLRLAIIRATIGLPVPGWLQALIWGWQ